MSRKKVIHQLLIFHITTHDGLYIYKFKKKKNSKEAYIILIYNSDFFNNSEQASTFYITWQIIHVNIKKLCIILKKSCIIMNL